MPRLIRGITSIFNLEDSLLDSGGEGGCCKLGDTTLLPGLDEIPIPTTSEQLASENARVTAQSNMSRRIYTAMQDPDLSAEDFVFLAKVVRNNGSLIHGNPGLSIAFLTKLSDLSSNPNNSARDLLMLEKGREFLSEASAPSTCSLQLGRNTLIGTHTFEDYGPVILENI